MVERSRPFCVEGLLANLRAGEQLNGLVCATRA